MSPLPEILFEVARNPILAVGLPIGLGAISGIITGQTSRSNWFTTMSPPPAKQKEIALANILGLTGTVVAMTVKMHGLNTPFSTTWFLAPYCAWLGYATYINAGYVFLNNDRTRKAL
ncbi:MAG: hypothetical protein TREMPRED_002964 [Tremellales sp. Tagirdzhanova-0007]|nr:MAG: hypothetical protein TREMPRED_002964 [Tremellales sp. Tagirdzhanova-0007]